jgi:hypothetical protein
MFLKSRMLTRAAASLQHSTLQRRNGKSSEQQQQAQLQQFAARQFRLAMWLMHVTEG